MRIFLQDAKACQIEAGQPRNSARPGRQNSGGIRISDLQDVHLYVGGKPRARGMSSYFHCRFGVVQRSRGGSALRRSTYQSRSSLILANGTLIDYSASSDHVETLMLTPIDVPDWALVPKEFWRRAAAAETRADAQEARLMELALPRGLSRAQWADIARKIGLEFVAQGMIVQADIHCTTAADGGECPHVHFQISMRELINGEFAAKKARHWNMLFHGRATALRKTYADFLNAYCKKVGVAYTADPRANLARGLPIAEMALPRWNILAYKRTGKKTPWMEQRDQERAKRQYIIALEAYCKELERKIARYSVRSSRTLDTRSMADHEPTEAEISRLPIGPSCQPTLSKQSPLDQIMRDRPRCPRSRLGGTSSEPTEIPDLPSDQPHEPETEATSWRYG